MTDFIEKLRAWFEVKLELKQRQNCHNIREGEIWWCAIGENVGVEINGKNKNFTRPVVIIKKLSHFCFLGVPLTSQEHTGTWYAPFLFKNRQQYAAIAQIRVLSVYRLYRKMGEISRADYSLIKNSLLRLYF
jgi:mRNA interferase MazF